MTPGTPDIAELKRLMARATKGPYRKDLWGPSNGKRHYRINSGAHESPWFFARTHGDSLADDEDASLIVAALNALPSLLASAEENARLREENERLEDLARDVCTAGCDDDIARALHALRDFLTPRIAERARARAALGAPKQTLLQEALFVCAACDGRGVSSNQPEGCTDCLGSGRTLFGDSRSTS